MFNSSGYNCFAYEQIRVILGEQFNIKKTATKLISFLVAVLFLKAVQFVCKYVIYETAI